MPSPRSVTERQTKRRRPALSLCGLVRSFPPTMTIVPIRHRIAHVPQQTNDDQNQLVRIDINRADRTWEPVFDHKRWSHGPLEQVPHAVQKNRNIDCLGRQFLAQCKCKHSLRQGPASMAFSTCGRISGSSGKLLCAISRSLRIALKMLLKSCATRRSVAQASPLSAPPPALRAPAPVPVPLFFLCHVARDFGKADDLAAIVTDRADDDIR